MKGKRLSRNRRSSWQTVIVIWLSGLVVVMYSVAFLAFLIVSWLLPGDATLAAIIERCLATLTPLVAAVVQHYLRQRRPDDER